MHSLVHAFSRVQETLIYTAQTRLFLLVNHIQADQSDLLLCDISRVSPPRGTMMFHGTLAKASKEKETMLSTSFNVKILSSPDKTDATPAATLISLAAATVYNE